MISVRFALALLFLSAASAAHCDSPDRPNKRDCFNAVVKRVYVQDARALFIEDGLLSGQDALADRWLEVAQLPGNKYDLPASKLTRCIKCGRLKPGRAVSVCRKPSSNLVSGPTWWGEDAPFELVAVPVEAMSPPSSRIGFHSPSLNDSSASEK